MNTIKNTKQKGDTLVLLIVVISVFSCMMFSFINLIYSRMKAMETNVAGEEAFQIAEAGINYYEWHLAHFPNDYQDGTGKAGPYIHTYTDRDTEQDIGQFSLTITPPTVGSTVVTIQSTAFSNANPNFKRTITARYGIPSLALYSFLSNDIIWIGSDETVNGQFQSNNGVRFDGVGNAPIQSAKSTYTCNANQGSPCPALENGVWGGASQAVKNFWQFPVPAVDFSALTSNLASMKSSAQNGGIYLPPSNASGYSLVFNTNGTVSVYKITSLASNPNGWDINFNPQNQFTDYNGRTLQFTQAIPANGIIYIEDNTWVEGAIKGRVTVTAAKLPYDSSSAPTIYIPHNILYAAKDGTNSLGLIAQQNIVVTYHADDNLEIDAALIAQNGSTEFFYYPGDIKTSISIFGSIMTFGQWTWTWVDGGNSVLSGYKNTMDTYDGSLLYAPPPSFPISSSGYQLLSWKSN